MLTSGVVRTGCEAARTSARGSRCAFMVSASGLFCAQGVSDPRQLGRKSLKEKREKTVNFQNKTNFQIKYR